MIRNIVLIVPICIALSGCITSREEVAMNQAYNLCGRPTPSMTVEERTKAQECYQRAYPQFLGVETQRRSAIDQEFWGNMESSTPKQTHCTGTGSYVNCTTF